MDVRRATRDDVAAIQQVARESWAHDYPAVVGPENVAEGLHEDWYSDERIEDALDRDDALLLVAEDDGVVGFAHGAWSDGEGDVLRLYVRPDARDRGVGSELLAATVEELSGRDVERVRAMVLRENDRGNAFYRAEGFALDEGAGGETKIGDDYYAENVYVREV